METTGPENLLSGLLTGNASVTSLLTKHQPASHIGHQSIRVAPKGCRLLSKQPTLVCTVPFHIATLMPKLYTIEYKNEPGDDHCVMDKEIGASDPPLLVPQIEMLPPEKSIYISPAPSALFPEKYLGPELSSPIWTTTPSVVVYEKP